MCASVCLWTRTLPCLVRRFNDKVWPPAACAPLMLLLLVVLAVVVVMVDAMQDAGHGLYTVHTSIARLHHCINLLSHHAIQMPQHHVRQQTQGEHEERNLWWKKCLKFDRCSSRSSRTEICSFEESERERERERIDTHTARLTLQLTHVLAYGWSLFESWL